MVGVNMAFLPRVSCCIWLMDNSRRCTMHSECQRDLPSLQTGSPCGPPPFATLTGARALVRRSGKGLSLETHRPLRTPLMTSAFRRHVAPASLALMMLGCGGHPALDTTP